MMTFTDSDTSQGGDQGAPPPPAPAPAPPLPTPRAPSAPQAPPAQDQAQPAQPPQPKPTPRISTYTPRSSRPHTQWGSDSDSSVQFGSYPGMIDSSSMPTPQESYGIIRGAGQQLGNFAAPSVGQPASQASNLAAMIGPFLDYWSHNRFSDAYRKQKLAGLQEEEHGLKMQEMQMRMQHEHMLMARDRMLELTDQAGIEHQRMLKDYGEVFERMSLGDVDQDEAKEHILELNAKYNHTNMNSILENGGLGAVQRYIDWEDQKFQDMQNATRSLGAAKGASGKTVAEESELDKAITGTEGGGTSGGGIDKATGAPLLPLDKGGDQTTAGKPAAPGLEALDNQDAVDDSLKKKFGMGDTGTSMAHSLLQDGLTEGPEENRLRLAAKKNSGRVIAAKQDMATAIKKIASGPQDMETKIDSIEKIDPQVANKIKQLGNYDADPAAPEFKNWSTLASQVNSNYKPAFFKIAQKYKDPNSKEGVVLARASTLPTGITDVMTELANIDENDPNWKRTAGKWSAEVWTGDPRYAGLHAAIRTFATDAIAIGVGTGTPRVQLVNELIKGMTETNSPAQIRRSLLADAKIANRYIDHVNQSWKSQSGLTTNAPGLIQSDKNDLDAQLRMNPNTGEMPSDAPPQIQSLGKTPGKLPSWAKKGVDDWKPLTRAEVDQGRQAQQWLLDHPNDPLAKNVRDELYKIRIPLREAP